MVWFGGFLVCVNFLTWSGSCSPAGQILLRSARLRWVHGKCWWTPAGPYALSVAPHFLCLEPGRGEIYHIVLNTYGISSCFWFCVYYVYGFTTLFFIQCWQHNLQFSKPLCSLVSLWSHRTCMTISGLAMLKSSWASTRSWLSSSSITTARLTRFSPIVTSHFSRGITCGISRAVDCNNIWNNT